MDEDIYVVAPSLDLYSLIVFDEQSVLMEDTDMLVLAQDLEQFVMLPDDVMYVTQDLLS